jgi:hypothetical protein
VKKGGGSFLVELRAEGEGPPAVVRLRRWLKAALRQHGLRCVRVQEMPGTRPVQLDKPASAGH